jgi:hypothetical protein
LLELDAEELLAALEAAGVTIYGALDEMVRGIGGRLTAAARPSSG